MTKTHRTCACVSTCGDDPNVEARRVRGCERYRAKRDPQALAARCATLRECVVKLVGLLDRMEPDVPEDQRASEDEWMATKAEANALLAETE